LSFRKSPTRSPFSFTSPFPILFPLYRDEKMVRLIRFYVRTSTRSPDPRQIVDVPSMNSLPHESAAGLVDPLSDLRLEELVYWHGAFPHFCLPSSFLFEPTTLPSSLSPGRRGLFSRNYSYPFEGLPWAGPLRSRVSSGLKCLSHPLPSIPPQWLFLSASTARPFTNIDRFPLGGVSLFPIQQELEITLLLRSLKESFCRPRRALCLSRAFPPTNNPHTPFDGGVALMLPSSEEERSIRPTAPPSN